MPAGVNTPLSITSSITGQAWRWRANAADARGGGFDQQDLLTQLLLARGCPQDQLEVYRTPSIRAFMPDPSLFRDMDSAATRIADAVERQEQVTIFGDYDVEITDDEQKALEEAAKNFIAANSEETIAELAVGDACTGSNPRTIDPATMERLFTCIYYGTEVDF